jgi:hypothetical protein
MTLTVSTLHVIRAAQIWRNNQRSHYRRTPRLYRRNLDYRLMAKQRERGQIKHRQPLRPHTHPNEEHQRAQNAHAEKRQQNSRCNLKY